MDFVRSYPGTNEPLTRHSKPAKKWGKKCSTCQRFICPKVTSYKIHILIISFVCCFHLLQFFRWEQNSSRILSEKQLNSAFVWQLNHTGLKTHSYRHSSYNAVLLYHSIQSNVVFLNLKTAVKFYLTLFFKKIVKIFFVNFFLKCAVS